MHTSRSYNLSKLNKYRKKKTNAKNVKKYNFYDKKAKYYSNILYGGAEETVYKSLNDEEFINIALANYENNYNEQDLDVQLYNIIANEYNNDNNIKTRPDLEQIIRAVTFYLQDNERNELRQQLIDMSKTGQTKEDENLFNNQLKTYEKNIIELMQSIKNSINLNDVSQDFNNSITELENKIREIQASNINTDKISADLVSTQHNIMLEMLNLLKGRRSAGDKIKQIKDRFDAITKSVDTKIEYIKNVTSTDFAAQYEAMLYVYNYLINLINSQVPDNSDFDKKQLDMIDTPGLKKVLANVYEKRDQYLESLQNPENENTLNNFFNTLEEKVQGINPETSEEPSAEPTDEPLVEPTEE
ncbi:hypothetical protein Hokovirus_3_279 [Hokovirus HKV1]|uniref:Uncharacterized protein n=1 Tax=Hokovirus HKV1 TaxID=1977638 RepID=A0A1V0SGZ8_9VIRU|nr:hypothetical protein Hokovirus_3_279 [Hokovirus HKV1]